jgi:cytoskeleton protein RodZ
MDIGEALRHAREERGLTIDALSRRTRVRAPVLTAIERNDVHGLPPRPYGRGFVRGFASEVGLDPDQTVRDFFSQFVAASESEPERPNAVAASASFDRDAPWAPWLAAAAIIVVVGGLIALWAVRSHPAAPEEGAAAPVVGHSEPAVASTVGNTSATTIPAAEGVTIVLEATGPSWVRADVDGQRVLYRTLQAGEREVLRGKQAIQIRTGDAGALRWQVGGEPATVMGGSGQVLSRTVTVAESTSDRVVSR